MKPLLFFVFLWLPAVGFSQVVDSVEVTREVDSLIRVSQELTSQHNFDKAMEVNASAEKIALEYFGQNSVQYGSCCLNHGRIYYYKGNYSEAEQWYLESKAIRETNLGKEHLDYAQILNYLAILYQDIAQYNKAETLFIETNRILEKIMNKEDTVYISNLNNLAFLYIKMNNYEKAEHLYLEVNSIRKKILGEENIDYAAGLANLAFLYIEIGNYEKAESLLLQIKDIYEKSQGKENKYYILSISKLAILYAKIGNYAKSESFYLKTLTIGEKVWGKESRNYAMAQNNLGVLYTDMGDYKKAEPLLLEANAAQAKIMGLEHPDYAMSLDNLANLYRYLGDFEKSEPLYLESLSIRGKVLGKEHTDYARSLNNLALLYMDINSFEKSEPLFLESKNILEKKLGKEHFMYALSLNNLAYLFSELGAYEKAEPCLVEAAEIWGKTVGKEHPQYAGTIDNLASIYIALGIYDKSERLILESNAILEKTIGKDKPEYARNLVNLATLYQFNGDFKKAEALYLEAKTIFEKALGKENKKYIDILQNLANLYDESGDITKSESLYIEAKDVYEKMLNIENGDYAKLLGSLGNLYFRINLHDKSIAFYLKAIGIWEKIAWKEHPDYISGLFELASIYSYLGEYEKAKPFYLESTRAKRHLVEKSATFLSERESQKYIRKFDEQQDRVLSVSILSQNICNFLGGIGYDNTLFFKGFLLNAAGEIKRMSYTNSATTDKFNRLKSYHRRLATQYSLPIAERDSAVLVDLEEKANTLEKDLVRTVAGYGEAIRQVNWQEVQQQLKPGEAAVEFIDYHYYNPKPTDSIMYAALLLQPGAEAPRWVTLCEERNLATLVKGASSKAIGKINALYAGENAKTLYNLIWKPLEPYLSGAKTVYISPSGLLHRLNLGAVMRNDGRYIGDQYRIVTLGSTRQLVLSDAVVRTGTEAVLVGGVRYVSDSTAIADVNSGISERNWSTDVSFRSDTLTRGSSWTYLPETALEVQDIQKLLQSSKWTATLDTGYSATEEKFRILGQGNPSPRILHVATHGFFYPDPKENPKAASRNLDAEPVFKLSEHPMIRSGLLLAGADEAWSTGKAPQNREDGILTAYEISQMNLSNTELVVLSACETGLGEIEGNEGVYGLQRAFKIAGAKYLIMSLWEVSDKTTRELMADFYRQWLVGGLNIPEAFRTAQSDMRKKYPTAPYLWAGFVLVE